jgi:hypothetical protein
VRKALATVLSKWCFHVILAKVTPRYVTVFTKGMSGLFGYGTFSGTLKSSGEIDRTTFLFIDLYVPALTSRIHCSESALQFAETMPFLFLCRVNTGIVRKQQDGFQVSRGLHLHIDCTILGQGRNLEPVLLFFLPYKITFYEDLKFSVMKEAVSLMRLVKNSNSDNLCGRSV